MEHTGQQLCACDLMKADRNHAQLLALEEQAALAGAAEGLSENVIAKEWYNARHCYEVRLGTARCCQSSPCCTAW